MRQFLANSLFEIAVRARKSPWIETEHDNSYRSDPMSGLVRARGLKHRVRKIRKIDPVRARKSPWIETVNLFFGFIRLLSGLVRARGLKRSEADGGARPSESGLVRARGLK